MIGDLKQQVFNSTQLNFKHYPGPLTIAWPIKLPISKLLQFHFKSCPKSLPPEDREPDDDLICDSNEFELSSKAVSFDSPVASREGPPISPCI
jgi:hypothetical protein